MAMEPLKDKAVLQQTCLQALTSLQDEQPRRILERVFSTYEQLLDEAEQSGSELSQQLETFQDLSDLLPGFLWTADASGSVTYINQRFYQWTGANQGSSLGEGWIRFVHPPDREKVLALWTSSVSRGVPYDIEYRLLRKDHTPVWFLVRGLPKFDQSGKLTKWFGCSVEIDKQHNFKDELSKRVSELSELNAVTAAANERSAQSELTFRTMCEASPELIWTADPSGNAQYFNAQFQQYSGLPMPDLAGFNWFNLVHPDEREVTIRTWKEAVQASRDFEHEMRMLRSDGEYRWFLVRSLPIKDKEGNAISWCGSCTNIDTHRRLVVELKHARDQAQSALKVKSEFVANVSHELRTPLNGILGMVEVLLRGDLSDTSKEHVSTIREAGGSLLSIINDILDFSKIEAGKMELSSCRFDPLSVIEGVAEILVPQAAAKNLLLLATVDPSVPETVWGDPLRLRQVLINLCGNAIKFTDQGQIVLRAEVSTSSDGISTLAFSVIDSGIGISEQFQNRLFEPFMQAEGSAYRSTGGTGLGLSISKHLVELMGGHLFVTSKTDIGSMFSFNLPLIADSEIDKDWQATAWKKSYGHVKLLTLEPRYSNQSVICAHLCALGIAAQSTDNPEYALRIIESMRNSNERFQGVCLDTIRYKEEAKAFLEAYKKSTVFGLLNIIEIGTQESLSQARSTLVAPRTHHLSIPLRRKQIAACLDGLAGWKPKDKNRATRSLELESLQTDASDKLYRPDLDDPFNKNAFNPDAPAQGDNDGASLNQRRSRDEQSSTYEEEAFADAKEKLQSVEQNATNDPASAKSASGILRRALVADDNKINQQVALLFLQDMGFIVDVASDGIEAVSAFKSKPYDMVFLDCQMPGIDGFEACKIIKEIQQRRQQKVPVIAVTANAIAGSREECLALGMDDYLSKPIDPEAMNKMVARWLGLSDLKITMVPSQESTPEDTQKVGPNLLNRVIDFALLRTRFNEDNLISLLRMFRGTCNHEVEALEAAVQAQNIGALRKKAHAFKGACSTICAPRLFSLCARVEELTAPSGDFDKHNIEMAATFVAEIRRVVKQAENEIAREILQQTTTTS
jgi:two-component system sensor histidine kinase/response regulator